MSAVIRPAFSDRGAIRSAEVANATFSRALQLGYGRVAAAALSRQAKAEAADWETPSEVAMRLVRLKSHSATLPCSRPLGPDGAA